MDGHDARHDGHSDPQRTHFVHKVKVGVGVKKELRDGGIGAGIHLGCKVLQIALGVTLLRVVFGVSRHFNVPVVALCFADEFDELIGVTKVTCRGRATGQVTSKCNKAANALGAVGGKNFGNARFGAAHTRQVRRGFKTQGGDVAHGAQRFVARGAARAIGDAEKLRLHSSQVLHHGLEFFTAQGRVGREKLKAQRDAFGHVLCVGGGLCAAQPQALRCARAACASCLSKVSSGA